MSRTEAKKIIKKYAETLQSKKYPFSAMYLFGSYAKGREKKWSDIDVAVISNRLKKNYERNRTVLSRTCLEVDSRLESHGFTKEDFENPADPLAYEIRKTGIKVI